MPKAKMKTASGTIVSVDGTKEEILAILAAVEGKSTMVSDKQTEAREAVEKTERATGLSGRIIQLKNAAFFKKPRTVEEGRDALAKKDHHYTSKYLSVYLIRLAKRGILRKIKRKGDYLYVNP